MSRALPTLTPSVSAGTPEADRHAASCDALAVQLATASPAAVPALVAVHDVHAAACGRILFSDIA